MKSRNEPQLKENDFFQRSALISTATSIATFMIVRATEAKIQSGYGYGQRREGTLGMIFSILKC